MESMGKSLALALGHTRDDVNTRIRGGQVIESFLVCVLYSYFLVRSSNKIIHKLVHRVTP